MIYPMEAEMPRDDKSFYKKGPHICGAKQRPESSDELCLRGPARTYSVRICEAKHRPKRALVRKLPPRPRAAVKQREFPNQGPRWPINRIAKEVQIRPNRATAKKAGGASGYVLWSIRKGRRSPEEGRRRRGGPAHHQPVASRPPESFGRAKSPNTALAGRCFAPQIWSESVRKGRRSPEEGRRRRGGPPQNHPVASRPPASLEQAKSPATALAGLRFFCKNLVRIRPKGSSTEKFAGARRTKLCSVAARGGPVNSPATALAGLRFSPQIFSESVRRRKSSPDGALLRRRRWRPGEFPSHGRRRPTFFPANLVRIRQKGSLPESSPELAGRNFAPPPPVAAR